MKAQSKTKQESAPKPAPKATKTAAERTEQKAKAKPAAGKKEAAKAAVIKLSIPLDASAAVIDKAIKSIDSRGKKLDIDIHSAACASLNHVTLHGDPTLLNRLINAMPKAARRNALVIWAMKFGKVLLNEDSKTKEERPLVYAKDQPVNIEQAQREPFYSLRNVREGTSEWLYMDFIGGVMKTLERHVAGMDANEGAKAKAALEALKSVNQALAVPAVAVPGGREVWTDEERAERVH